MPRVDVLIPAYNAERFLAEALDSVEAQTYKDWRIVLVDDGSTDRTREIADAYAGRLGERFHYVYQKNQGVTAARNTGLRSSGSEFIAMLDADDVWLPTRLEDSVQSLDENPGAGLAYGFVSCIDAAGRVVSTHTKLHPEAEGRIARSIYTRLIDLPCVSVTLRRAAVDEVGLFDETLRTTEDRDLWLRIAQRREVVRIPRLLAHYRLAAGSLTGDPDRMFRSQMQFIEKHRGSPGCDEQARRIARSSVYRQRAESLGVRGKTWEALASAARAVLLQPLNRNNVRTAASILWHKLRPLS